MVEYLGVIVGMTPRPCVEATLTATECAIVCSYRVIKTNCPMLPMRFSYCCVSHQRDAGQKCILHRPIFRLGHAMQSDATVLSCSGEDQLTMKESAGSCFQVHGQAAFVRDHWISEALPRTWQVSSKRIKFDAHAQMQPRGAIVDRQHELEDVVSISQSLGVGVFSFLWPPCV